MKVKHNVYGWINGEVALEGETYREAVAGSLVNSVLAGYGSHTAIYSTAPPEPVDYGTKITKRSFTRRLNPIIREALRNTTDEMAIDIREDLNFTSHPDLSDPDLIMSLAYLVYAGFMTQAESDYVLNTPVAASEI
mgnify:CR=1 FL=1